MTVITAADMRSLADRIVGTYINFDGHYGNQCWDLSAYVQNFFGLPVINTGGPGRWPGWAGNMVDAFPQTPAVAEAYVLLPPTERGLPGDTFVWSDANSVWFPATHVAICVEDTGNGWPLTISQNSSLGRPDLPGYSAASTGPIIYQNLPKQGLLGIIRPRGNSASEASMGITPASSIINDLQEAGVALELKDLEAIQGFVQTERATVVAEVRSNAQATVNAITDALDKAVWAVKTFDQSTDNENADRVIHDFRAQLAAIKDQFTNTTKDN